MYAMLALTILIRTSSDICFKLGVNKLSFPDIHSLLPNLSKLLVNPFIWVGAILAISNIYVWSLTLVRMDLNYAYPFTSISYILIILAGKILFKEKMDLMKIIGITAIAIGAFCLILGAYY